MERKIRVAFIGLAHIHFTTLYNDFIKYPDKFEFVGMADYPPFTEEESRTRLKMNVPESCKIKLWDDYKELLKQNIDVAIICTDVKDHADISEETLGMGIHTLVEKPMTMSIDDAKRMYRAYKKSTAELIINWPVAWMPAFRKVKQLVDEGVVGKVFRVHYRNPATMGPYKLNEYTPNELSKLWWYKSDRGGGSICDYASYGCTLISWITGKTAKRVSGFKKNFLLPFSDVEDYSTFTIDYGDCIGIVEGTWCMLNSGEIPTGPVVYGEKGTLVSDRYDMEVKLYEEVKPYTSDVQASEIYKIEPFEDCIALNIINFINKGEPLFEMITADFNIKVMPEFDAGIRSCKSGAVENTIDPFEV